MRLLKRTVEAWPYLFVAVSMLGFAYIAMISVR
jgi:hypothetical protein